MARTNSKLQFSQIEGTGGPSIAPSASERNDVEAGSRDAWPLTHSKRAANDDIQKMAYMVPAKQAKKRAALTNLTNQGQAANESITIKDSKSQFLDKRKTIAEFKHLDASHGLTGSFHAEALQSFPFNQNNENLPQTTSMSYHEADSAESIIKVANAVAIAALEQETKYNLYISNNVRAAVCEVDKESTCRTNEEHTKSIADVNKGAECNSLQAVGIYQFLRFSELKRCPKKDYMESVQRDINANMRGILVDWLVEVAEEYKLVPDTLYLTVAYIDRFLSATVVNREHLQLVGVACMLVAAKYEEICAPQPEEFCYITDNTYHREEILDMERRVLKHLESNLTGPTTKTFLRRFIRAVQASKQSFSLNMEFLGNYLAELTLQDYGCLKYPPSMIAGSAVFVAKFTLEPNVRPWNSTLQQCTGYKPSDLRECIHAIHDLQKNMNCCTLTAIREKYRQHKFKCVANLVSPKVIPLEYFEDCE